jgi:Sulfotransferase domain
MSEFKLDFTGIGAAKAGTTWIAGCLAEHPAVCMALPKEANFFLRKHIASCFPVPRYHDGTAHYDEGFAWYEQRFRHHRPGQLYGEFSNAYLADPECAGLLHAHNPKLKLLACFRNPVDAAYAGYFQLSRVQPLSDVFEDFLAAYPHLLEYGRYHRHLQPFLKLFPREQIRFMLFDDIRPDPPAFYRGICEFLGVEFHASQKLGQLVNPRTVLRSRTIRNLRCAVASLMARSPASQELRARLTRLGAGKLALRLFRMNEKPGSVPPMRAETRRRLVEYYREDNEALGEFLGRDLSHWNELSRDESAASASGASAVNEPSLS